MILDTSAVAAMAFGEADGPAFASAIESAPHVLVSACTLLEISVVVTRRAQFELDEFLASAKIEVRPFDLDQATVARHAYLSYGKGSGSPARLNMGDCFSYALATTTGLPLLFKGDDFTHTDVVPALSR